MTIGEAKIFLVNMTETHIYININRSKYQNCFIFQCLNRFRMAHITVWNVIYTFNEHLTKLT